MNYEVLIYDVMNCLYEADLPIVFKGAMVLKTILKQNDSSYNRSTRDLDADYTEIINHIDELENRLNIALTKLNNITVKAVRNFSEHTSAGFVILLNNEEVGRFDISIRNNPYKELYKDGNITFYGQTIDKILADKIIVLSSRKIYRRIKDLIDLYFLSSITNIDKNTIIKILKDENRELDDFSSLYDREQIEHAYDLFKNDFIKPEFEKVYSNAISISKLFK